MPPWRLRSPRSKGLYKKARAGQLKGFTGIDDPYERRLKAELVLDAATHSADPLADQVIAYLRSSGKIASSTVPVRKFDARPQRGKGCPQRPLARAAGGWFARLRRREPPQPRGRQW